MRKLATTFPYHLGIIFIFFFLLNCKGVKKAEKIAEHIEKKDYEIFVNQNPTKEITLDYIGCSGFLIRRGNEAVLNDPYFSNLGPMALVLSKKVKSNTKEIKMFFDEKFKGGKDLNGMIKFLLVSHTHYDHMADVPLIYKDYLQQETVKVLGSNSMVQVMDFKFPDSVENKQKGRTFISGEPEVTTHNKIGKSFFNKDRTIKITPIESSHADHFYCKIHLFKGEVDPDKKFKSHKSCTWKEGMNLSFFIDFLDENEKSELRIYINGAANSPPLGCPPQQLIDEKTIDIAILCMASYKFADDNPKEVFNCLLKKDQPTQIIFSHWENFFQPLEDVRKTPMVVPFTNAKKFLDIVNKDSAFIASKSKWTIPQPGVHIKVKY